MANKVISLGTGLHICYVEVDRHAGFDNTSPSRFLDSNSSIGAERRIPPLVLTTSTTNETNDSTSAIDL